MLAFQRTESDNRRHAYLWINRIKDRTNIENARSTSSDQPHEVLHFQVHLYRKQVDTGAMMFMPMNMTAVDRYISASRPINYHYTGYRRVCLEGLMFCLPRRIINASSHTNGAKRSESHISKYSAAFVTANHEAFICRQLYVSTN